MKTSLTVIMITLIWSYSALAAKKVAVVTMLRGQVDVMTIGKTSPLKEKDSVEDGAVIKTAEKSFVKIVFFDKSQMSIGPNSEMRIEKFTGDDSGVIDLVKGKIRSQVTKDYLQMNKDKSKLFIKTPNAVMGIRGTDFMISTNGTSTNAILFEGSVVFNKLDSQSETNTGKLEDVVNSGVRMHPGEFSVMDQSRSLPTEPALLNIQQIEKLEKNQNFETDRNPSNTTKVEEGKGTVVPGGLNGTVVSNDSATLKGEVAKVATIEPKQPSSKDPDGFVNGDRVKPANGSFIHVDSGVIIPPGPGSVLDANSNTYIPGQGTGTVNQDGSFSPPKNVEITPDGKIFVAVTDKTGSVKVQEIQRPVPILTTSGMSLDQVATFITQNPTLINSTVPVSNDILNPTFAPSGLTDLSNFQRNSTGGIEDVNQATQVKTTSDTNIIVKPTP